MSDSKMISIQAIRTSIFLFIVSGLLLGAVTATPNGVSQVDELRANYIGLEKALWEYLNLRNDQNAQLKKIFDSHRKFIADHIIRNFSEGDYFILHRFFDWGVVEKDLLNINGLFEFYRTFLRKYTSNWNERANLDFTETVFKDKELSIPDIIRNVNNVMVTQTFYYRAMVDARDQICATMQSAQQFLFSLYSDISLTELKGYTMMQFSWMILKVYGKGNFTHEPELMRQEFENRTEKTQTLLREVMKRADRIVWRCDPTQHVKGVTYDEITRLLQGYIENEVDMNDDQTCRENCGYYSLTKSHGCFKDLYCSRQPRCSGRILSCQYVDSDMWVCPSRGNDTRRYEYIEYESGRTLGKKGRCVRGTTKVDSWWRWLFWHCSYCFCLCDEQGIKSDRYFNLRETTSDTNSNMIVTGVRFVKSKRVFHLQIQEGKLLNQGNVDRTTLRWKPLDDYQVFDREVQSGVDYHTMAWDKRGIDLDDLSSNDPTHIIIGVRFRVVGTRLNLEVKVSEFNFETGQLRDPDSTSFWISNDNTESSPERRTEITINSPDVSIYSPAKSVPVSRSNQYIEFTNSDMDKDAAQSTVPFIDTQEVISNPPAPLSGIGIYFKGRDQFGGFIAPRLITYDFSPHVRAPSFNRK